MEKILKILRYSYSNHTNKDGDFSVYREENINEAVKELEENIKEDAYMLDKIEQSLSMGAKAQSLAIVEVYQILKNRNKDNK